MKNFIKNICIFLGIIIGLFCLLVFINYGLKQTINMYSFRDIPKPHPVSQFLQLTARSDKKIYNEGEEFTIFYELKNISTNVLIPDKDYYVGAGFYFINQYGQRYKPFMGIDMFGPPPLAPGESSGAFFAKFKFSDFKFSDFKTPYKELGKHYIYVESSGLISDPVVIEVKKK